jgi:hypothetical protein
VRKKTNTESAEVPQRNTEKTGSVLLCDGSRLSVFVFFAARLYGMVTVSGMVTDWFEVTGPPWGVAMTVNE